MVKNQVYLHNAEFHLHVNASLHLNNLYNTRGMIKTHFGIFMQVKENW
jgi:hypothetical protein